MNYMIKLINKKNILIFALIFIILLLLTIIHPTVDDLFWSYGFSYNIAKGLIPYKDFNMVIGPFYNLLLSIPLLISNNILTFEIIHLVVYSTILLICYKKINYKIIYLIILISLQRTITWYNTMIALLIILILVINDSNNKYKDLLIGLIIGSIIMTKQNIGIFLIVPYLIISKNKIKSLLYISIPVIISFIYLLITNSFIQYINYCFIGVTSFTSNIQMNILPIIILIIIITYLIYKYIKTKDKNIFYVLTTTSLLFPIFDNNHLFTLLLVLAYYILLNEKKTLGIIFKEICILLFIYNIINLILIKDNVYISKGNLYSIKISKEYNIKIKEYSKYIYSNNKLFIFTNEATLIKLYSNLPITKYDLLNTGNIGTYEDELINNINNECNNNKCIFILDYEYYTNAKEKYGWQYSHKFKEYVEDNYTYIKDTKTKDKIYSN